MIKPCNDTIHYGMFTFPPLCSSEPRRRSWKPLLNDGTQTSLHRGVSACPATSHRPGRWFHFGGHLGRDIYSSLFPFLLLPGSGQDNEIKLAVEGVEERGWEERGGNAAWSSEGLDLKKQSVFWKVRRSEEGLSPWLPFCFNNAGSRDLLPGTKSFFCDFLPVWPWVCH